MGNNIKMQMALAMLEQHERGLKFNNLSNALSPRSLLEAYDAQDYFHKLSNRGGLGGYKIALTSKVQQELTGVKHPLYGGIFLNEIRTGPTLLAFENRQSLGLEFELAVTLAQDVHEGHQVFDESEILNIIDKVYPAFEIIIDRNADYTDLDAFSMVVDNVWCGGIILGEPLQSWKEINLNKLEATLKWNENPPEKAFVGDADPLRSLWWVINALIGRNKKIPKGSVIITGSVFRTRNVHVGDQVHYSIGSCSEVSVNIV